MNNYNNYKNLKIEIKRNGLVLAILLNKPEIHNAFDDILIEEMIDLFEKIKSDKSLRLITIEGNGKSFCAGADLNWMKKMKDYSEQENQEDSIALANLFKTINISGLPVLGYVHGAAIGGGSGLVSVCDYVLAMENTKFGFTEVRLGLLPAVISPFVIAKIKESYARAYFLSGQIFNEHIALNMGLIHEISSSKLWEENKERVVNSFLKAGPKAAITAKILIKNVVEKQSHSNEEDILDYTSKTIAKIRVGSEAQEGMKALLEKKRPSWTEKVSQ